MKLKSLSFWMIHPTMSYTSSIHNRRPTATLLEPSKILFWNKQNKKFQKLSLRLKQNGKSLHRYYPTRAFCQTRRSRLLQLLGCADLQNQVLFPNLSMDRRRLIVSVSGKETDCSNAELTQSSLKTTHLTSLL